MSAPEKIYMSEHTASREGFKKKYAKDDLEYTRSDLYEQALAECKRHEKAVKRLLASPISDLCPEDMEESCPCNHIPTHEICRECWKAYAYKEAV